jgi:hypothetical protein
MRTVAETNAMVSIEAIQQYREQLAVVTAERDTLKVQAAINQANMDWIRMRINTLELERTQLIEAAYHIKLPAPELLRVNPSMPNFDANTFSFEDVGEKVAKDLGLISYDTKQ